MAEFCHLHVHSQYSLLDGAAHVDSMLAKAKEDNMKAMAVTDHGNMFGAFKFVKAAKEYGIKPIVGCEFYMSPDRFDKKDRARFHQLILAKNDIGYKNLTKLCSLGFIEGYYYYPRIDKELLKQHCEGLIATTCCLAGEIPRAIIDNGEEEAEKLFKEWLDIFGEDYYIELMRHGIDKQDKVNEVLMRWSKKYQVKMIATNDSHYVNEADWEAHDILLCLQTGKDITETNRFKFDNDQFYFKTTEEMSTLFKDNPEAIANTIEIADKVETLELKRDVLLPNYTLPNEFADEDAYLKHLTYEGAKLRYPDLSENITQRLDHELQVTKEMGFSGYFLIVQDFVQAAKEIGVAVGPGRGSAAGSAIAFCTGITNIDPVKYNLLFERFLNPERVNMPDIDIDFDDEGRQKVIEYVINKYGKSQVAQIITFGTMAAKMSIRDVGRVLKLPLPDTDRLAKLVPEGPGVNLKKAYKDVRELADYRKGKGSTLEQKTLMFAEILEGSARHTGIHAAGIIIAPDDLMNHIPLCTSKDSDLVVTQYDGKVIEDAGMLKMDFLGLKTLSIIKDAVKNIENGHDVKIDIEEIPLDDQKTFELFQKGDTVGIFQFESEGMRNYLKELEPTNIEDLIAMNALFRPGPMDHIPEFINRKHGKSKITYPHEWLEDILRPTYGVLVYQEQIMQTAQIIGGYELAAADILRVAMGKKKLDEMERQKKIFIKGAEDKGVDKTKAEEIFAQMEKFAMYGFNRSHSAAYSVLAFQTAYLKAHYPGEFMSAVLTHNMNDIKQVNFFLNEAKRIGLRTLGPDINESDAKFVVNENGEIRFALAAIKGIGGAAVEAIVAERNENGPYLSIFDLTRRVNNRAVNKKCLESLTKAGAFDCYEDIHRAQYFNVLETEQVTVIEKALKFGGNYQNVLSDSQNLLFDTTSMVDTDTPTIPNCVEWSSVDKLKKENEVTGIYISGHPLDEYKLEIDSFCTEVTKFANFKNRSISIAGVIVKVKHRVDSKGRRFALFSIEDYTGIADMALFSEDYLKWKHLLEEGETVFIKGRYQLRYKSDDRFEFRVNEMNLLSSVKEKFTKEIIFMLSLKDISDTFVQELEVICKENPWKCDVIIKLIDPQKKYVIQLVSNSLKIRMSEQVKEFLDNLPVRSYILK